MRAPKSFKALVPLNAQTAVGIVEAKDDEAVDTLESVLLLIVVTADVMFPAVARVPAVMFAAREVLALSTVALVLAFTAPVTAAMFDERLVEAAVISVTLASDPPNESVASVRLRVPKLHTAEAV